MISLGQVKSPPGSRSGLGHFRGSKITAHEDHAKLVSSQHSSTSRKHLSPALCCADRLTVKYHADTDAGSFRVVVKRARAKDPMHVIHVQRL